MDKLYEHALTWYAAFEDMIRRSGSGYIMFPNRLRGPFEVSLRKRGKTWKFMIIGASSRGYTSTGTANLERAQNVVASIFSYRISEWSQAYADVVRQVEMHRERARAKQLSPPPRMSKVGDELL